MMPKTHHYLYSTWKQMRIRCNSPTSYRYQYYGARGITVCSRWDDFWLFVEDMGERPEGHTLDRIDTTGNYEPANCRWADHYVQHNNQGPRHDIGRQTCSSVANNPMRYITKRGTSYRVCKSINRQVINKTFPSLDAALDFRANLEMEAEMNNQLTNPYL